MTGERPSPPAMQRGVHIYGLLGALQSALWFFGLSPLCKALWPSLFGFSSGVNEVLLYLILAPYFVLYGLLVALPIYLLEWDIFEQFRISKDPWPWKSKEDIVRKEFWRMTSKSLFLDFMNVVVYMPCFVYAKTNLFPERSPSFSVDDWPTYWEIFTGVWALAVVHEFGFYSTHRFMHSFPSLYKYHKVHHEYKRNIVVSAEHFHPVDFFFSIIAPVVLSAFIVQPHSFTQALAGLWIVTANLDDHLGYNLPWSPVRWFPLSAGTDAHEFHHSINMGMYGSKLSLWDWVFQTDKVYETWRKKRWGVVE